MLYLMNLVYISLWYKQKTGLSFSLLLTAGTANADSVMSRAEGRDLTQTFCASWAFFITKKVKGSPYSITERTVPELIPVLGSQPAGDVSHKPGGRLPLLSARSAVTPAILKRAATNFCCLLNKGTMGVNSLPKSVIRQRRGCDLNPGPSAPESSTLTTRLPSHPFYYY